MRKSEALHKMVNFFNSLPESLSIEKRIELLLNFQQFHLNMLPPPLHQNNDVAYNCEWENELEIELHDPWVEKDPDEIV